MATTQVIDSGEYLEPDFNPEKLTIPLLRNILLQHEITTNGSENKKVLISKFIQELKPKAADVLKERNNIQRSSIGIENASSDRG